MAARSFLPDHSDRLSRRLIDDNDPRQGNYKRRRDTTVHYEVVEQRDRLRRGPGSAAEVTPRPAEFLDRLLATVKSDDGGRERRQQRRGEIWATSDSVRPAVANYLTKQIDTRSDR